MAPLFETVPPRRYGGTERVVAWLTDELVRRGHDVTLFATAGSETSARLVPCAPGPLRATEHSAAGAPWHVAMLEEVAARARSFDIIHFHIDQIHLPLARRLPTPSLTTLHGRLDLKGLDVLYETYHDAPLVSISHAQRAPLPRALWLGTVHHGLPLERMRPGEGRGGYLVFLGRITPEKGPVHAIEIARRAGKPLKIAAKVDEYDRDYFERVVRPLLGGGVEMLGEVGEPEKDALLGDAEALLFPIEWPEPFGLVMIEAMARGTPVIAFPHGSVPEVVRDGVTGFVVRDVDEAVRAVRRVGELDRRTVRAEVERRFSVASMTDGYLRLYEQIARPRPQLRTVAS
ncbi:MAG TPA: glycosyltransferase family 4 protein [Sandaracinaceae bacterium]